MLRHAAIGFGQRVGGFARRSAVEGATAVWPWGSITITQLWLAPHLGQVKGSVPLRIDQPQSVQVSTSSPNIPRTIGPHLAALGAAVGITEL